MNIGVHVSFQTIVFVFSRYMPRQIQISYTIIYMWNIKTNTNEHIYKTERHTDMENKLMVTKGESGGKDK